MKKVFALALPLLFSLCTAQTLDFWAFGSASETENTLFQSWVDAWNERHPDTPVELTLYPTAEYVSGPVLTTAFASGTAPRHLPDLSREVLTVRRERRGGGPFRPLHPRTARRPAPRRLGGDNRRWRALRDALRAGAGRTLLQRGPL